MASIYKRKRDRQRKGSSWYIAYADGNGIRRTVKGCPDKAATEAMARTFESESELRRQGVIDSRTDVYATHEGRPLADHLTDWHAYLIGKGSTQQHSNLSHNRVADFHAQRHSYITALDMSNAPVKVVQTLARHSTPTLTLGVYAHVGLYDGGPWRSGGGGIRTHGRLAPTTVFKTVPIGHSGTPPEVVAGTRLLAHLVDDLLGDVDRHVNGHGNGDRVARSGVDLDDLAVVADAKLRVIRMIA